MTELERLAPPPVSVDLDTLRYLGYDPDNVATRALVLLATRYQLDPLLGEIQLISDSRGRRLYVTRDGMLAVAHASGHLDGIVVDEMRRNSTGDGWTAYVSVYRNDMTHPFRYGAQCKDSEDQAKRGRGPEMALARAERRALKRAFRIRSDFYPENPNFEDLDSDADIPPTGSATVGEGEPARLGPAAPVPNPDEFIAPTREQDAALRRLRIQLGLMSRENADAWRTVLSRAVGRELSTANIDRRDADRAIDFLTRELAAQAQALADAARDQAPYIEAGVTDPDAEPPDEGPEDDGDDI